MATAFFSGKYGAVAFGPRIGGVKQPLSQWSVSVNTPEIDQSDYDQPTAKYAKGIPTAVVSFSGPYPTEPLLLKSGDNATVTLFLDYDYDVGFTLPIQVTTIGMSINTRGVAQFEGTAVCTGNFQDGDANTGVITL